MATWYAIVRTTNGNGYLTGAVESYTTSSPLSAPAGTKIVNLGEQGERLDLVTKAWDPVTETLVPIP